MFSLSEESSMNPWPEWREGICEKCGEPCVNQFLEEFNDLLFPWRAVYWDHKVICTGCADSMLPTLYELTDDEINDLLFDAMGG